MADLAKIQVQVNSLAKPVPQALLAARTAIRVSPVLQAVFIKARAEGWSAERLADTLHTELPAFVLDEANLWDTALYLADEFTQLGDSLLLVSHETGQAIARITENDIYLPAPLPREGTDTLAQPLPRLRPDLEGLLVEWRFTQGREVRLTDALAKRAKQTPLLRQEGDNRLLRVTKKGRQTIVDRLREDLPTLLQDPSGIMGEVLRFINFQVVRPEHLIGGPLMTVYAKILTPVVDPLTFNLHHDPYTALKTQITAQWVRGIATGIASCAFAQGPVLDASVFDTFPNGVWIADPNTAIALKGKRVLPVEGAPSILLHYYVPDEKITTHPSLVAPVAYIYIRDSSYQCSSREFLDRWEVGASFEYEVFLDLSKLSVYRLRDVETYAEVLA